jgi:hypothetical protein
MSRSRRRGGKRGKSKTQAPALFWGREIDDDTGAEHEPIPVASDPTVMVRSLGRPPLPGHENVAEHYFAAVYEKASGLAMALAATTGLLSMEELEDEFSSE